MTPSRVEINKTEIEMGRRAIKIDKTDLVKVIAKMESEQTFSKQTDLWNALAKHYGVSNTHIYQLVKKLKIEVKTAKGQRGMALKAWREEQPGTVPGNRASRADKIKSEEDGRLWSKTISKSPNFARNRNLAAKAVAGSLVAMIQLKCIECCNEDRIAIKECVCTDCPLWYLRPYQDKTNTEEEGLETEPNLL